MKNQVKTVSFYTIGCRVNQYETAVLRNTFGSDGFKVVSGRGPSDIVVINTCTVTENSDSDTGRLIRRLVRLNPKVKIALIGCQAQIQQEILKRLPNVHWVIGNARKLDLQEWLASTAAQLPYIDVREMTDSGAFRIDGCATDPAHTRANLKIQDGCDNFCSYCEVPYARGAARSREFQDIIREAWALVQAGHQEIVLTGINLGAYRFQEKILLDIIRALEDIPELQRIRISSIEPGNILDDLICYMTGKTKLCRFLHIPVQHGHDDILGRMKRKYSAGDFAGFVTKAAAMVPDLCIGTDVIVGFPSESEDHFEETCRLLKDLPVHYFHVFSFSARRLAEAGRFMGQVSLPVIQERSRRLRALSSRKRHEFYSRMLGRDMTVLFEQKKQGVWSGMTDNFIRVKVCSKNHLKNTLRSVQLTKIDGHGMAGQLLESGRC